MDFKMFFEEPAMLGFQLETRWFRNCPLLQISKNKPELKGKQYVPLKQMPFLRRCLQFIRESNTVQTTRMRHTSPKKMTKIAQQKKIRFKKNIDESVTKNNNKVSKKSEAYNNKSEDTLFLMNEDRDSDSIDTLTSGDMRIIRRQRNSCLTNTKVVYHYLYFGKDNYVEKQIEIRQDRRCPFCSFDAISDENIIAHLTSTHGNQLTFHYGKDEDGDLHVAVKSNILHILKHSTELDHLRNFCFISLKAKQKYFNIPLIKRPNYLNKHSWPFSQ